MTPESRYSRLVDEMSRDPEVILDREGKGFGSRGQLKVNGRIFAMLVRGELVLKLPRARVDELVARAEGRHFDAGQGKPLREWFVLYPTSKRPWPPLAREAHDFVREERRSTRALRSSQTVSKRV